ncbi:MAG: hypothetical protein V7K50_29915 [Nostoc sp.]|uniref:hypothetical protein n=1 Tax=Nostoc sp. TaxID=1180 RepID=UPI002FFCE826
MKVDGNGQGKILTQEELKRLFTSGFITKSDRSEGGRLRHRALEKKLPVYWLSSIRSTSTPDD